MKKIFTKEIQVAFATIVGLVVLFFGLQFLKGLSVTSGDNYVVVFDDVSGVSQGNPVYANGFRVGTVEVVNYNYADMTHIPVIFGLDPKLSVPKGSFAEVSTDMMGNVSINLRMGPNPVDLLHPGDTLTGHQALGLMDKAGGMLPQLEQMLPKLDSILMAVNTLMNDPALTNVLHNVDASTHHLTATTQQLSQLSTQLNRQVPSIMQHADATLAHAEQLTQKLSGIDVDGTMASVRKTLDNVEQMTAAINSREGTVGLLLHDPTLYNNLSKTMFDADALMQDLKENPKRYVHFSVFGKKQ
jgi:phospholipid/cholesterol/gamma-HCH transport system substrate-binding protein